MRISDPLGFDDEPDYEDARCMECGAAPDERCTDDCECEDCLRRAAEDDEPMYAPLRALR